MLFRIEAWNTAPSAHRENKSMQSIGPIAIRPLSSSQFYNESALKGQNLVSRLGKRVDSIIRKSTFTTHTASPHSATPMYRTLLGEDPKDAALVKVRMETVFGECISSRLSCDEFIACHYRFLNKQIREEDEVKDTFAAEALPQPLKSEQWVRRSHRRRKRRRLFSPNPENKVKCKGRETSAESELSWTLEQCKAPGNLVVGFLARRSLLRPSVVVREMSADFLHLYFKLRRKVQPKRCETSMRSKQNQRPIYGTRIRLEMYIKESVFKEKCSATERTELLWCTRGIEAEALRRFQAYNFMSITFAVGLQI